MTVEADAGRRVLGDRAGAVRHSVITVAATLGNATGYARRTVIGEFITGTTVLDVTDPDGRRQRAGHVRVPDV